MNRPLTAASGACGTVPRDAHRAVRCSRCSPRSSLSLAARRARDGAKGGEGLYGKTDDKVITNFGFGLMIFFTLLVIALSVAQYLLEKRKPRK